MQPAVSTPPLDPVAGALASAEVLARCGRSAESLRFAAQAVAYSPDPQTLAAHLVSGRYNSLARAMALASPLQPGAAPSGLPARIAQRLRRSLSAPSHPCVQASLPPAVGSDPRPAACPISANTLDRALARLHQQLQPAGYLEFGGGQGHHLALARCPAIGVDPLPPVRSAADASLSPQVQRFTATSEEFFAFLADDHLQRPPDLVLLAGLPLAEQRLRELRQLEPRAAARTLVAIPGIFPTQPERATRRRSGRDWQGDLWKLPALLAALRPDLRQLALDVQPAGLLLLAGLDRSARAVDSLSPALEEHLRSLAPPPLAVLQRSGAQPLTEASLAAFLATLNETCPR